MRHKFGFILFFALLMMSALLVWHFRNLLVEKAVEIWLNQTQSNLFNGSIDVEGVQLQGDGRLSISRIQGDWQAPEGPFRIEINQIEFLDSLLTIIRHAPMSVRFGPLRPGAWETEGVHGNAVIRNDVEGAVEIHAEFLGLPLESVIPLDPEHLQGATGQLTGTCQIKTNNKGTESFQLRLNVIPPGGRLQARFFDVLIPYIPAAQKSVIQKISASQTVGYREAKIDIERTGPESVKVLLHILVPDYNLNLNLNLTLRVESQDVFLQLAELFGLIKVNAS